MSENSRVNSMRGFLVLAFLVASPLDACAQWAETPDDAARLLTRMVNGKVIGVSVGQRVEPAFGYASFTLNGTWRSYKKGVFGRLSLKSEQRHPAILRYKITSADNTGPDGSASPCVTTLRSSTIEAAFSQYALREKSNVIIDSDDYYTVIELEQAPREVQLTPHYINWSKASFRRFNPATDAGYVSININTPDQRLAYSSFVVKDDAIANYVENAIRILQLTCPK